MRSIIIQPLLAVSIVFSALSCDSNDDDNVVPTSGNNGGGGGTLSLTTSMSSQFALDGTTIPFSVSTNTVAASFNHQLLAIQPDISTEEYGAGFMNSTYTQTYFSIRLGTLNYIGTATPPTQAEGMAYFAVGARNYDAPSGTISGAAISWWDGNNEEWSTNCGTGSQSGSAFNITEVLWHDYGSGLTYIKAKGTFNCKLYKCTGSGMKTVTAGTFVLEFSNH